jgi:Uncharacterized conserved protein (DUF2285)
MRQRMDMSLPESAEPAGPLGFVRPSRANLSKELILENSKFALAWFEMGFAVDLSLPLDDQLKAIRMLAEESQLTLKRAGRIDLRAAKASDRYVLYLRILDAEDAGEQRSVIADELFPDVSDDYQDYRRVRTFDNARAEARRLRDYGYRALAHRAKASMYDAMFEPRP